MTTCNWPATFPGEGVTFGTGVLTDTQMIRPTFRKTPNRFAKKNYIKEILLQRYVDIVVSHTLHEISDANNLAYLKFLTPNKHKSTHVPKVSLHNFPHNIAIARELHLVKQALRSTNT